MSKTTSRTYTDRSNCRRAALKELGEGAFKIEAIGDSFRYVSIDTTRDLPPTRVSGEIKRGAGFDRLRKNPEQAEAIRKATVAEQDAERARQAAKPAPLAQIGANAAKRAAARGLAPEKAAAAHDAAKAARKPASEAEKPLGKRAAILAAAEAGKLPEAPDFSAETHARFRNKLAELVRFAKAGDVKALKDYPINPISSSPKAMDRYRNLCVIALEARAKARKAA